MPSPFTPGWFPDRQHRVAREAQNQGQRSGPLPLVSRGAAPTVTTFDYPNPSYLPLTTGRYIALRANFSAETNTLLPDLLNKDKVFGGAGQVPNFEQQQLLPPIAKAPARENLDFVRASAFQLLKDAVNPGRQSFDLPPRAAARATTDTYSICDASEFWMLTDARNAGAQSTDLPPRAATRARDYSWSHVLIPTLVGKDATVVGQSSEDLPPRAAARARDYSITAGFPLELIGQDAMAAGQQRVELPTPAPPRARDYTWLQSLPLNLNGRDAMTAGQQLSGNTPPAARRASTLVDPGVNLTLVISQAPPVIPQGLSTALSELPPRGAPRAPDYSFLTSFPLELVGKDQVFGAPGEVPAYDWSYQPPKPRYQQGTGEAVQDLLGTLLQVAAATPPPGQQTYDVPRPAARTRDYTFVWPLELLLLGQDATNPGVQLSGNAPGGPRRSVDYTFLASFPLELIGRDAMATGQQSTALPLPPAPRRARDYSIAASFPLELVGKDAMVAGAQLTDLAPRGAPRLREYTHLATYALANTTPQRDLSYVLGSPSSAWSTGTPLGAWHVSTPGGKWQIGPPQQ